MRKGFFPERAPSSWRVVPGAETNRQVGPFVAPGGTSLDVAEYIAERTGGHFVVPDPYTGDSVAIPIEMIRAACSGASPCFNIEWTPAPGARNLTQAEFERIKQRAEGETK